MLWQRTCDVTGACLLYDTNKFRLRTYGVALGFQIVDIITIFVLLQLVKKRVFAADAFNKKAKSPEDKFSKELVIRETNL